MNTLNVTADAMSRVKLFVTRDLTFSGVVLHVFGKGDMSPTVRIRAATVQLLQDYLMQNHFGESVFWFLVAPKHKPS